MFSQNNNNNNISTSSPIMEDGPRMRSVAMMPGAPILSMPRPQAFSKGQPFLAPALSSKVHSKASNSWNVDSIRLESVPEYYHLERTHIYVEASPHIVAERIANCLKEASIATTYHGSEALVDAETTDNVQLCVRLWADDYEGSKQVIAEVQRVSGCCYQYCQSAKMIMRAAKGLPAISTGYSPPPSPTSFRIPACIPRSSLLEEEKCTEGLDIAMSMFLSEKFDCKTMALELLIKITSASSKCRAKVAQSLLEGPMLKSIISLIESKSDQSNSFDDIFTNLMHKHAITLLTNCLSAMKEGKQLCKVLEQHQETLQAQSLLFALILNVSACAKQPHEACESLKCLQILTTSCPGTKSLIKDLGVSPALAVAKQEGSYRHASLHRESQLLHRYIQEL